MVQTARIKTHSVLMFELEQRRIVTAAAKVFVLLHFDSNILAK